MPQNVEFEIKAGQSVMHLAEDHGLYVKSVCRGVPSCAECRVRLAEGDSNVLPPGAAELQLIGSGWFIDRRRLSCQLHCIGDVTVDLTEQIAKKDGLIGGRKTKKAQSVGDRVEEEIKIRDTSAAALAAEREQDEAGLPAEPRSRQDRPQQRPHERPQERHAQSEGPRGSGPGARPGPGQAPSAAPSSGPRPQKNRNR